MKLKKKFKIGNIFIGENNKCLIIAEISANHNNNFSITQYVILHTF